MSLKFSETLALSLKGKNLSSVAREVGMPRVMLHEWVKAKRVPSLNNLEHIKNLAAYLGLTLEELLIGEEDKRVISAVSFSDQGRNYRIIVERVSKPVKERNHVNT